MTEYTLTEPNWRVLKAAISIPNDLVRLMQLIADGGASKVNRRLTLESIRTKADTIKKFCEEALKQS